MTGHQVQLDLHGGAPFIEVPLTQGRVALVDADDADLVLPYRWHAIDVARSKTTGRKPCWYARRALGKHEEPPEWFTGSCSKVLVYMHNVVWGGLRPDHRNGDGLDNRRANLRPADRCDNAHNADGHLGAQVPFKGVWRRLRAGGRFAFVAEIQAHSKSMYLGTFDTAQEAALAYDAAAREFHGKYARLNFPE